LSNTLTDDDDNEINRKPHRQRRDGLRRRHVILPVEQSCAKEGAQCPGTRLAQEGFTSSGQCYGWVVRYLSLSIAMRRPSVKQTVLWASVVRPMTPQPNTLTVLGSHGHEHLHDLSSRRLLMRGRWRSKSSAPRNGIHKRTRPGNRRSTLSDNGRRHELRNPRA
jgi:hypothetical protein